ncbi:MAG: sigma 54-interacting transcriptional regulator [Sedimentibacter sp.]|uniref:sigma-54 interaction domain-containing protein n=1 Tax=Sedimentibacter sp. TaxID=1960295 RepID=UPI003158C9C7
MEKINFENILKNVLETQKLIILLFDKDFNLLYFSDNANEICNDVRVKDNISSLFDQYDIDEYNKVMHQGVSLERIMRIGNSFYVSSVYPYTDDRNNVLGIIETLYMIDEKSRLSNEIKRTHMHAYAESEIDSRINIKNGTTYSLESIITNDNHMKHLISLALRASESDSPVLIYGETGTGKELFAQGIHNASKERRNNMFVAQNCAAIPETLLESLLFGTTEGSFTGAKDKPGLFEIAEGGTIYLDEINSMAFHVQAKLLRVLQEKTFMRIGDKKIKKANVRVIASFNEEPFSVVKKGKFRRDLYYRLNVINIKIPSLKERISDIELLTNYFIRIYNKKFNKNILSVDKEAMNILKNKNWEGNVRELKNNIERIMNFAESNTLKIEDIYNHIAIEGIKMNSDDHSEKIEKEDDLNMFWDYDNKTLVEVVESVETNLIRNVLNETCGNVASAARKLGLPRQTLKNKIIKYNIKPIF